MRSKKRRALVGKIRISFNRYPCSSSILAPLTIRFWAQGENIIPGLSAAVVESADNTGCAIEQRRLLDCVSNR